MKKCLILGIITTLVSLFMASDAHAFGRRCGGGRCFSGGGCYSSCYTPCYTPVREIVEVPVAVPVLAYPVLVPAFQFQYVPPTVVAAPVAAPVVPVTGYPVASPIVQPVAPYGASPYGYGAPPMAAPYGQYGSYGQQPVATYGQQPAYPQQQQAAAPLSRKDQIRELARALLEEMNKMAGDDPLDSGPPSVPGTQPQFPAQPQQPLGQVPFQQPQQPQQNNQQLAQFAVAAMARTCAQCHTGVGSKHDMVIFTQPGLLNQNANWKKIKDEISSGRMPPKDTHFQLNPQEKQSIVQWLASFGVN